MNVANMEVLPMANTISQWPPFGNDSVAELKIGNIGTGNISTLATLNGRCRSGSLLYSGETWGDWGGDRVKAGK